MKVTRVMTQSLNALLITLIGFSVSPVLHAQYYGQTDSMILRTTGCNAVSYSPIPEQDDLFVGRSLFKVDGTPATPPERCASPAVKEAISAGRGGLALDKLNWNERAFSVIKPLLIVPMQISVGRLAGAVLKNAYDPYVALYRGRYLVSFECIVDHAKGVRGTSSCLATLDMGSRSINQQDIHVVVSGMVTPSDGKFHAASVPALLTFDGRLYLYWSELTVAKENKFERIGVRGAELEPDDSGLFWVKGTQGKIAYSLGSNSVEVWGPNPQDPLSNTAVDLKSIWVSKAGIVALVALGGSGCAAQGPQPGCFRMAMAKADKPLGDHIFNQSRLLDDSMLPTNGQGYTRPIRAPDGGYSFAGVFYKPTINGLSETRSILKEWKDPYEYVVFPFPDRNLWPIK